MENKSKKQKKKTLDTLERGIFYGKEITDKGITLIAFAISRKCVRYEERA